MANEAKTPVVLDRVYWEGELKECHAQRDTARQQIIEAQQMSAQAQQNAQIAERNVERCNGAEVQIKAALKLLG